MQRIISGAVAQGNRPKRHLLAIEIAISDMALGSIGIILTGRNQAISQMLLTAVRDIAKVL
jgi:hypothetical protein